MNTIKEQSLTKALTYCGISEVPEEFDGVGIWVQAIVLVQKSDGTESYVYADKDLKTLELRFAKDFGTVSMIRKVLKVYPYNFLKDKYVPKFKTQKKEERVKYLSAHDKTKTDWSVFSLKELDREVVRRAIRNQMEIEKIKNT